MSIAAHTRGPRGGTALFSDFRGRTSASRTSGFVSEPAPNAVSPSPPSTRWMKNLLLAFIAPIALGCIKTQSRTDAPEERARGRLAELVGPDVAAEGVREIWHVDGTFGFLRARLETSGKVSQKIGIDGRGLVLSVDEAKRAFVDQHRATWGALTPATARLVSKLSRSQPHPFGVWYDQKQLTLEDATELAALFDRSASIEHGAGLIALTATRDQIVELALQTGVQRILDAEAEPRFDSHTYGDDGPADYSRSRPTLNAAGYYGVGASGPIRIGIHEPLLNRCTIGNDHDAFQFTNAGTGTIRYYHTPASCSSDSECRCLQGATGTESKCVNGLCRVAEDPRAHTHHVASRVAASVGSMKLHAAEVALFVSNDYVVDLVEQASVLDWFVTSGVQIVNLSFGPDNGFTYSSWDSLLDQYSYEDHLLFVKSAGNGPDNNVTCDALSNLCVGATLANATYEDDFTDDDMDPMSSWRNPVDPNAAPLLKDAERPDLVSQGTGALVASAELPDEWLHHPTGGTSMATPVVTGLVALLRDCREEVFGTTPRHTSLRAMMRNASWTPHTLEDPSAPFYPFGGAAPAHDAKAGVGIPSGSRVLRYCEETTHPDCRNGCPIDEEDNFGAGTAMNLWEPLPAWMQSADSGENNSVTVGNSGEVIGALKSGQNLRRELFPGVSLGTFRADDRLRVSLSFMPCPDNGDGSPAVDYDLVACSESQQECFAVSESFDDTNEGFDVIFSQTYADVKVFAVRSSSAVACERNGSEWEPFGAAGMYWRQ